MYDPEHVTDWLASTGLPSDTTTAPAIQHYLDFYSLNFEGIHHTMGYLEVDGDKICTQQFSHRDNQRGTAFVLHGYLDHSGLQNKVVARLLSYGMDVVMFDQPGHGLSTGDRANVHTFDHYTKCLTTCIEHFSDAPQPITLVGHSMGGAVCMTYLLQAQHAVDRAVLVAPLFRPRSWRFIRGALLVGRRFIKHQPRRFVRNTRDEHFYRFITEIDPLSPRQIPTAWVSSMFDWAKVFQTLPASDARVLVVQGTEDGTVDWRGNMKVIRRKFHNVRIHLVHEGRHHLLNEIDADTEPAWQVIDPFLKEH